jgi:hypothetical protein
MRVAATPYRKSAREVTVALTIDLDVSTLTFTEKKGQHVADLEVRHLATDADHKIYPLHRVTSTLALDDEEYLRAKTNGIRFASQFDVPVGRYQVRVAAASGTHNGSVVYDMEIPDFAAGPMTMSGVSLTTASAVDTMTVRAGYAKGNAQKVKQCRAISCEPTIISASTLVSWRTSGSKAPESLLGDVLPAAPTTVRAFNANDTLTLFAELYDNNPAVKTTVPYDLTVRAELRTEAGAVIHTASDKRPSQESLRPSGGHGFTLRMPLSGTPSGSYLLHLEGRSASQPDRVVTRDIPIQVQ